MKEQNELIFPDLIYLDHFKSDFTLYFGAVYKIFHNHFIKSCPIYNELNVSVRKYPEVDGIHRTFYHITHEGENENNRTPDLRRMERIRFPKFVINNNQHVEFLVWENNRKGDKRILILNDIENYVLILSERKEYYLFITAYCVDTNHRKRSLIAEYNTYIKTKTA